MRGQGAPSWPVPTARRASEVTFQLQVTCQLAVAYEWPRYNPQKDPLGPNPDRDGSQSSLFQGAACSGALLLIRRKCVASLSPGLSGGAQDQRWAPCHWEGHR